MATGMASTLKIINNTGLKIKSIDGYTSAGSPVTLTDPYDNLDNANFIVGSDLDYIVITFEPQSSRYLIGVETSWTSDWPEFWIPDDSGRFQLKYTGTVYGGDFPVTLKLSVKKSEPMKSFEGIKYEKPVAFEQIYVKNSTGALIDITNKLLNL